jgi:hypothetical protein
VNHLDHDSGGSTTDEIGWTAAQPIQSDSTRL